MPGESGLGLIAEVGIALLGFVAIVMVLRERDGGLSPLSRLHARGMMTSSICAVFPALLVFALYELGWRGEKLWRGASIIALVGMALGTLSQRLAETRTEASWKDEAAPLTIATNWALALLLSNALGWPGTPSSGLLILALALMLLLSAVLFLQMVLGQIVHRDSMNPSTEEQP